MKSLSVILPVKNEGKRLSITICDISAYLKNRGIKHEIIAVLSPSEDHSHKLAQRLNLSIGELKVIELKEDKGKKHAIKRGIKEAKFPWVLCMDSDNSVSVVEIGKMLSHTKNADLILSTVNTIDRARINHPFQKLKKIFRKITAPETHCAFVLTKLSLAKKSLRIPKVNNKEEFQEELATIARKNRIYMERIPVTLHNSRD